MAEESDLISTAIAAAMASAISGAGLPSCACDGRWLDFPGAGGLPPAEPLVDLTPTVVATAQGRTLDHRKGRGPAPGPGHDGLGWTWARSQTLDCACHGRWPDPPS